MSIQIEGPLFEAVQSASIFPDSKTFVDALPNKDISLIEKAYAAEKDTPNFNLKAFLLGFKFVLVKIPPDDTQI